MITNGNLDLAQAGLAGLLHPGLQGRGGRQDEAGAGHVRAGAAEALGLAPGQILHVGSSRDRTCWGQAARLSGRLPNTEHRLPPQLPLLPDVEFPRRPDELDGLLPDRGRRTGGERKDGGDGGLFILWRN